MTILDTHIWVWWVDGGAQLPADYTALFQAAGFEPPLICTPEELPTEG